MELDPESQQVQDILDNYHDIPQGFLTNITIIIPNPNDEDGEWFMIAPLFRTLIGQWIGIGPFFDKYHQLKQQLFISLFYGVMYI